jgi:SAM-dependent methyltransferase
MAAAYPQSEFHGYDSSEVAIRSARKNLATAGLANVTFHHADGASLEPDDSFDFIMTWDCLHDMTDPAAAMRAIRGAIKPDGTWLIVDLAGMPTPEENYEHPLAGLLYGFSVLDCLGCGTSADGGAGLGTLGLPEPVARQMVSESGFTRFTVREFDNPLNAFYEGPALITVTSRSWRACGKDMRTDGATPGSSRHRTLGHAGCRVRTRVATPPARRGRGST